jgi:hypothetical protein
MKALTLTQPWATLVAIGAKRIETRSWSTKYTGPIAIHAAKGFPVPAKTFTGSPFVAEALCLGHFGNLEPYWKQLPIGVVIGTVTLMGCRFTQDIVGEISERERTFGDYSYGRYAWFLSDPVLFEEPVPACGHLSLWEWAAQGKETSDATGTSD